MSTTQSILLVDDDPDIHQLLNSIVRSACVRLDSAYTAPQALERLEHVEYDIAVVDLRMPGMDGMELLRRIRQAHPSTRVLVITGESTPEHIIQSIREQAFAYFSKPFSVHAIKEMIVQALEASGWENDIELISARREWISLRVSCRVETADRLVQFLRELETDLPAPERDDIAVAFRELLMNAIEHGAKGDPQKKMLVSYVRASHARIYYVQDPGSGFSFESLKHAAVSNPSGSPVDHVEVRSEMGIRPGGFGILLTRQIADELIYNEKGNEVIFIKYTKNGNGH